jgi:hypothetical protein
MLVGIGVILMDAGLEMVGKYFAEVKILDRGGSAGGDRLS